MKTITAENIADLNAGDKVTLHLGYETFTGVVRDAGGGCLELPYTGYWGPNAWILRREDGMPSGVMSITGNSITVEN